ncbi:hypothetical protein EVAR_75074_1 [Eumeta japonica]|uniref:Uncharacterized protein n=1 Tax=Eumeta variegata TaxID=151549 RepID=A0A4C1W3C8_EUMVA|nr:hypothetical protein EVAR_75074_1 [Eumeta japonica]
MVRERSTLEDFGYSRAMGQEFHGNSATASSYYCNVAVNDILGVVRLNARSDVYMGIKVRVAPTVRANFNYVFNSKSPSHRINLLVGQSYGHCAAPAQR